MRIIEFLVWLLFFTSLFIKEQFGNKFQFVIILSASLLSFFYFIFSFYLFNRIPLSQIKAKKNYKDLNPWKVILSIYCGYTMSVLCIGILFKIMGWPSNNFILLIGSLTLILGLVVSGVILFIKKSNYLIQILYRGIFLLVLAFLFFHYY